MTRSRHLGRLSVAIASAALATIASPVAARGPVADPPRLKDLRGAQQPALDPASAVLVIIDAQREYVEGPLALEGVAPAIAEIARLRRWARANQVPIIHVQQVGAEDSPIFARGSRGAEIVPELTPAEGEIVVEKTHPNSFHETVLDAKLAELGRSQLILTGFMSHMCLDATARAAFDRDFTVYAVASATADRAIPDVEGRVLPAADLRRAALAALADRFAWVLPDARSVE